MKNLSKKIKVLSIIAVIVIAVIALKIICNKQFSSVDEFQDYIATFGAFGPLILTLFQAFQVVVPVLPGYVGCAAGAVLFGAPIGFICNYVGICVGSIAAFYLGKRYGINIILALFPEKMYNKWRNRIEKSKSYDMFLFLVTLLPLFPDDFFCYFSGLIKMDSKKFILIILLGKPWCILAYSIIFGMIK